MAYVRHPRCITPLMTSATAPSPAVVSSSSDYPDANWARWHVFSGTTGSLGTAWYSNAGVPQWVAIDLGVGNDRQLAAYEIVDQYSAGASPRAWKIQGSDNGTGWVDLDERTGEGGGGASVLRSYTLAKVSRAFRHFRIYVTDTEGYLVCLDELQLIGPKRVTPLPLRGRSFLR